MPAHHNYQVRLKQYLESRGIAAEWERDFVDVRFVIESMTYLGEIKVTTTLRLEEAFRTAMGQLLEYRFLQFDKRAAMVMFLDRDLDARRTALAAELGIAIIAEQNGRYLLQNPQLDATLAAVFPPTST